MSGHVGNVTARGRIGSSVALRGHDDGHGRWARRTAEGEYDGYKQRERSRGHRNCPPMPSALPANTGMRRTRPARRASRLFDQNDPRKPAKDSYSSHTQCHVCGDGFGKRCRCTVRVRLRGARNFVRHDGTVCQRCEAQRIRDACSDKRQHSDPADDNAAKRNRSASRCERSRPGGLCRSL